ncbi:hypothetical protein [Phenylobacterium sp.]|uniref:hypothetical protein n=1 Tax=Phenylobacterium sp. TaxID=1871053 RepID=UPI002C73393E|nr:hypothetical protein [Phenylobacterium sp.]HLZ74158.1 hypothetical protein [Phenylobacterium sp.]
MNAPNRANDTNLQLRLAALEIDLGSVVALSNALLQGVSATGPQMHHAIDRALEEALHAIATEDRRGSAAVHSIVTEVRERLRTETGLRNRMAQDVERLMIRKADALPSERGIVVEGDFNGPNARRPSAKPV